jgi:hypothetical protein
LVLADMAPAVQGDQIAGCSAQEARLAVEALAGLHGASWCDPAWLELSAISMPTALGLAFASSTERGDEMILIMLSRGCRAVRELDTLDLISS